jgi:hypothetical protein
VERRQTKEKDEKRTSGGQEDKEDKKERLLEGSWKDVESEGVSNEGFRLLIPVECANTDL